MSEFVDFLTEIFEQFGPVEARKMFGGYGLYHDGVMFGLIADEVLYLKADAAIARHFEARGLAQFSYTRGDKVVKMSYYLAPEEIYEDSEAAAVWARRSFEAAYRASRNKLGKSRKQK